MNTVWMEERNPMIATSPAIPNLSTGTWPSRPAVLLDQCLEMAARILVILHPTTIVADGDEAGTLRFRVVESGWKLATIVFAKDSLRNLARDPQREIKIQFLQRDLLRSATSRRTFTYPHSLRARLS